jgi:protein-S-isoprenylcysteine O-methyltransferase Ste14
MGYTFDECALDSALWAKQAGKQIAARNKSASIRSRMPQMLAQRWAEAGAGIDSAGATTNNGSVRSLAPLLSTTIFTIFVPGTVAGYIPWRLRQNAAPITGVEELAAIGVIAMGTAIYLSTAFWGFAMVGGGTPAPIAPTKILVVRGLHRYVRNPMYIGVALVVAGQAWLFHSPHIAIYLACVLVIVNLFVRFYEEPTLRRQFGEEYERYRARVPRWIPRFRR